MAITLTDVAAGEIKRYMEAQKLEPHVVLRLSVVSGGCAGLQYTLGFDTTFDPESDARYEQHGVAVVTSKKMALHLDGTLIDFREGPLGRGFTIDNPNVPRGGACPGCGHR